MKKLSLIAGLLLAAFATAQAQDPVKKFSKPWENGNLKVSENGT